MQPLNQVEIIQINISGADKPGMTSSLTEILARYDASILDIGQANIHQSLTLGILIRTTPDKSGNIMKELLFKASELGVMIRFTPISAEQYEDWVSRQGKNRYIITLLGRTVTARHIAEVTKVVAEHGLNIDAIKRLTGRVPLREEDRRARSCIELSVRGSLTDEERSTMQEGFMNLSDQGLDVSFQKDDIYRRSRRLICFDMDSTLIETEVIDELAERAGVGPQVREITASAMRGEIDFRESFTRRVGLLRGLDVSVMEEIARSLPITEGLERMMTVLKRVGYKTAILSGGFTYFGNYLRQKYGFDYVYANELEIEEGKLTGRYVGEIVDGRRKAELLRLLCQFEAINIAQSVAVGDGANDLPMLNLAGLGIAFHAKPKVKATARQSISTIGLDGILYFLGLKDSRMRWLGIVAAAAAAGCYDSRFGQPGAEQAPWTPTEHIAALRERYAGETFEVTGDIVVEGVVTSDDTRGNFYRSLCIEEQGAAIEIMTGTDHLHNDYPRGCRVVLRLRQLAVGESRGVLQAGRMPAPGSGYATDYIGSQAALDRVLARCGGEVKEPEPTLRTIGGLEPRMCGTLVRIEGLRYEPEELTPSQWTGYKRFTDAEGREIRTYVRTYADFAEGEVPVGAVALTGILQLDGKEYILKLRDENDCRPMP